MMVDSAIPVGLDGHVIITGADGTILGQTAHHARELVARAMSCPNLVVHFHGGLVGERSGLAIAESLLPVYQAAGAHPIFIVWKSGPFEILLGNLKEILGEDLFKSILKKVLRWGAGLLRAAGGDRAASPIAAAPSMDEVSTRVDTERDPYSELKPAGSLPDITEVDEGRLVLEVSADEEIGRAVLGALLAAGRSVREGSRAAVPAVKPIPSRIDPALLAELEVEEGSRSLGSVIALGSKLVNVLRRVRDRYEDQVDHGLYLTVLEEVARELYVAQLGGALWAAMKRETRDAFLDDDDVRGGKVLLDGLFAVAAPGKAFPRVTLVGHSTGAVYINNLLQEVQRRAENGEQWSDSAHFQVAFLAPACTSADFAEKLVAAKSLVGLFRMFTMGDEAECADKLLGPLYPRSLLYLVSGLVERDESGSSVQVPIVGLERYLGSEDRLARLLASKRGDLARLKDARDFLLGSSCVVRSPSNGNAAAGWRSSALSHSDFDDDPMVRESLQAIIRGQIS